MRKSFSVNKENGNFVANIKINGYEKMYLCVFYFVSSLGH